MFKTLVRQSRTLPPTNTPAEITAEDQIAGVASLNSCVFAAIEHGTAGQRTLVSYHDLGDITGKALGIGQRSAIVLQDTRMVQVLRAAEDAIITLQRELEIHGLDDGSIDPDAVLANIRDLIGAPGAPSPVQSSLCRAA